MTEELLPCPLCGDRDEFNPSVSQSFRYAEPGDPEKGIVGNPAAGVTHAGYYVECDKCGCCGPDKPTEAEAITAWGTRAALTSTNVEGLVEALTPSGDTKAAYHGEFTFQIHDGVSDAGIDQYRKVYVPWDTVKEIMTAIRKRAHTKETARG